MKKVLRILILGTSLILLNSCAKPTVVNVVMPEDEKLNCEELENAVAETQKIKKDAEYAKEENEITGGYGGDPLMKLKARELDLRAMDNERKKDYDEDRIGLDTMKVMVGDQQHDEKLEQNEELAELRAGVSLTKQRMADKSKRHDFGRNFKKK